MAKHAFLIRRKQDGAVFGPLTAEDASDIAGYPEDFEKMDDAMPSRAGYDTDEDGEPRRAARSTAPAAPRRKAPARRRSTKPSSATPATPAAPAAPAETKEG